MIQWNRVTWYSQLLAIILGVLIFALGYYLGKSQNEVPSVTEMKEDVSKETTSELADNGVIITFKGLENVTKDLPPLPSDEEWRVILNNTDIFRDRYEEDVKEYGDIAKRYHADEVYNPYYLKITTVDVTDDGVPENIIGFDGGGTYGIERYEIIENDKVIATIKSTSVGRGGGLSPDSSGNGFSMVWYTDEMFPNGYCCPEAQMETKFLFEDGKFKPVREEKVNLSNE